MLRGILEAIILVTAIISLCLQIDENSDAGEELATASVGAQIFHLMVNTTIWICAYALLKCKFDQK